ncbi:hypothetical protein GCM10023189_07050 [Nibrella saemangeumensis]|uniref:Uncharacterized protein n=1 Tax=Nibrella saemangeumensis TaxID=1084526 RepID=A0ABP8MFI9_9BACT
MNQENNINEEHQRLMAETRQLIEEARSYLVSQGKTIDLTKWVTIKEYVKRHKLESTNVVSNWIKRGIIPPDDIRDIPELNNLRLIRDRVYKENK